MKNLPKSLKIALIILVIIVGLWALLIALGVLSGWTLANLNATRQENGDKLVQTHLETLAIHGELYFDAHQGSYTGFCNSVDARGSLKNAARESGGDSNFVCNDDKQRWAASSPLRSAGYGYWCIDSTGTAVQITGNLTTGMVSCPP